MGPQLRALVERQLLKDLANYNVVDLNLKFDWSDSCIEGHDTSYLDGQLENFSGISVFDVANQLIANGWMEFVHEGDFFFLAYWEFVQVWQGDEKCFEKSEPGIPNHIWQVIPDEIKGLYKSERL